MNETEKQNAKPRHETQNSRKYVYDSATGMCVGVKQDVSEEEMRQRERERSFKAICDAMLDLYHRKNLDYGNSFGESYKEFGLKAAVIRLGDKYRRLKSLEQRENLVENESIEDTLIDMANYAIMTLVEMK